MNKNRLLFRRFFITRNIEKSSHFHLPRIEDESSTERVKTHASK
jgi:hypothetical protein